MPKKDTVKTPTTSTHHSSIGYSVEIFFTYVSSFKNWPWRGSCCEPFLLLSLTGTEQGQSPTAILLKEPPLQDRQLAEWPWPNFACMPYQSVKAMPNEETLSRTHCCRHKCFPFAWAHNICCGTQKMFLILFRNILCPQQMFPSLRSPRNIMGNNVSSFTRALTWSVRTGPKEFYFREVGVQSTIKRGHCKYLTTQAPPATVFPHPLQCQIPTHFLFRASCKNERISPYPSL